MSNVDPATYRPLQDGLRAVGHFLDTNDRRLTSLLVVAGGIVLTLMPRDLRGTQPAQPDPTADAVLIYRQELVDLVHGQELPSLHFHS